MKPLTIVQLPVNPRFPRMRSVELYEGDTLAVVGRSCPQDGTIGTYEEAADAAKAQNAKLKALAGALSVVFGKPKAKYHPETTTEAFPIGSRVTDDQGQVEGVVRGVRGDKVLVDFGKGARGWCYPSELRRER